MRLLTDEELKSWHLRPLESRRGIAKAQRDLTHKETLKAVGELIERYLPLDVLMDMGLLPIPPVLYMLVNGKIV